MGSDSNSMALRFGVESSFGVLPASSVALRYTAETLRQDTSTAVSAEIGSDRQKSDVIRTGLSVSGDFSLEMSYGTYDELLQFALLAASTWGSITEIATADTTVSVSAGTFVHATGWDTNPAVGDWISVTGFVAAGNNGLFKVLTVSNTVITPVDASELTNEGTGPTVEIEKGSKISNGTTLTTLSFEKQYTDLTNEYEHLLGCAINSMSLSITADAIMTGSFGVIGKRAVSATATMDATPTAADVGAVMNGIDNVDGILEGTTRYDVTSMSFELGNNLRARQQVGTLGAISLGKGSIDLTGTLQAYFSDSVVMNKYLSFERTNLSLAVRDAAGNGYVFEFPSVKFTSGQRVAGGINQDIIADLSFTAYKDATSGTTIDIWRLPVPA